MRFSPKLQIKNETFLCPEGFAGKDRCFETFAEMENWVKSSSVTFFKNVTSIDSAGIFCESFNLKLIVTAANSHLTELLKDSNYKLAQFSQTQIATFEESIFLKESRGKSAPYITCLSREKEIKLTPEEAIRQLYPRTASFTLNMAILSTASSSSIPSASVVKKSERTSPSPTRTTLVPSTIGVPLTAKFSQQVIKQLFDIAQLYDHTRELSILAEDNRNAFGAEARYRGFPGSYSDYLDDVIQAAFHICSLDLKGAPKNREEETRLYRRGILQLGNHLVSVSFRLREAKIAAAKAARLAILLKASDLAKPLPTFKPDQALGLREKELEGHLACLNRLKNFAPEVFFYWT